MPNHSTKAHRANAANVPYVTWQPIKCIFICKAPSFRFVWDLHLTWATECHKLCKINHLHSCHFTVLLCFFFGELYSSSKNGKCEHFGKGYKQHVKKKWMNKICIKLSSECFFCFDFFFCSFVRFFLEVRANVSFFLQFHLHCLYCWPISPFQWIL